MPSINKLETYIINVIHQVNNAYANTRLEHILLFCDLVSCFVTYDTFFYVTSWGQPLGQLCRADRSQHGHATVLALVQANNNTLPLS